ncbi:MAG: HPr kinase/phosphatase C-terminal domain-containing protein [Caulobacteraceae bacterium]|jgi:serine kinase of HPr protein (carbohydrate metabolism regulator)
MILHAGLLALRSGGLWRGVLIEGDSGSGKSDLALRALGAGFSLVADDRVVVFASGELLYGRAPVPLTGLIEVRGVGVLARQPLSFARVIVRVRLAEAPDDEERMPEPSMTRLEGIAVPTVRLWPFAASAPAKLAALIEHLGGGL